MTKVDLGWALQIIKDGGPAAVALLMFAGCVILYRDNAKLRATIETMHDEKEAMFREWKEETDTRKERLLTALSNSTVAITTGAANMDAVKHSLNAIMAFIGGQTERR